ADRRAFAMVASTTGSAVLYSAAADSDDWAPVRGIATTDNGYGQISIAEGTVWVALAGSVSTPLYRSFDGVTWARVAVPCAQTSARLVAAASRLGALVVCGGGGAAGCQAKSAYISANRGRTVRRGPG